MGEKQNEMCFAKSDKKTLIINSIIAIIIVILVVITLVFINKKNKNESDVKEFSGFEKICELATLRCYYHNVTEYEKKPDGLFKYGFFQYGYKKFWMEYEGIIEVGIDVSKVQIKEPDKDNVVRVYVPEATILNMDVNLNSMSDLISDKGVFTKITSEEQAEAYAKAQANMKENAENDKNIREQAYGNAKELLEQYITNVGKQLGKTYTVEWLDEPIKVKK